MKQADDKLTTGTQNPFPFRARKLLIVGTALGLAACATPGNSPSPETADRGSNQTASSTLRPGADKAGQSTFQKPSLSTSSPNRPTQPSSASAGSHRPLRGISMQALFQKGTVSGADLVDHLLEVRRAASERKSMAAAERLVGGIQQALVTGQSGKFDWKGEVAKVLIGMAAEAAMSYAQSSLDPFIQTMMDDEKGLRSETIQLPDGRMLNEQQKKRVVTMAALVVSARVAGHVLDKAKSDFENLEQEYERLLDRRQKLAGLLAEAIGKRQEAVSARDELTARQLESQLALSSDDIAFIEKFKGNHSLADFSNDFAMQNYALAYLRKRDPSAYAEYRAQADGWVGRTKAYTRTIGGVAAFGGLMAAFTNEVVSLYKGRNNEAGQLEILSALPFGAEFVATAAPLIMTTMDVAIKGVVVEPVKIISPPKRFRIITNGQEEDFRYASGVFDSLKKQGSEGLFTEALFRNGAPGLLYSMYQCNAPEVARMLDTAIPKDARQKFAVSTLGMRDAEIGGAFSFISAFDGNNAVAQRARNLPVQLLGRDQRKLSDSIGYGELQRIVSDKYTSWDNAQLTRLILANNAGSVSRAQMMIGNSTIRLIPSMTAVYEYEAFSESCRRTVSTQESSPPTNSSRKSKSNS